MHRYYVIMFFAPQAVPHLRVVEHVKHYFTLTRLRHQPILDEDQNLPYAALVVARETLHPVKPEFIYDKLGLNIDFKQTARYIVVMDGEKNCTFIKNAGPAVEASDIAYHIMDKAPPIYTGGFKKLATESLSQEEHQ